MIVGSGLLAEAFRSRYGSDESVTIHAAGVSNSSETDPAQFDREYRRLRAGLDSAAGKYVYFSSCVVGMPQIQPSAYVQHKARMERLVLDAPGGIVFRLPQVVGKTGNPSTLTNYLASHILEGIAFSVFSGAQRNLVDVDDIVILVPELLGDPSIAGKVTNIAAREPVAVPVLVEMLEQLLGRKAEARIVPRDEPFHVDAAKALAAADRLGLGLSNGQDYVMNTLRKYYG